MNSFFYHTPSYPPPITHSNQEKPMSNSSLRQFLQAIRVCSLQGGPRALVLCISEQDRFLWFKNPRWVELTHVGKFRNIHLRGSPQSLSYKPFCLKSLRKDSFTLLPVICQLRVSEKARCLCYDQSMVGIGFYKGSPEQGGAPSR